MTDIVEWLRCSAIVRSDDPVLRDNYTEAAAEIERLRTRYDSATDQAVRYADDNERLRAALESIAKSTCCDRCREAALVARHALEPEP